MRWAAHQNDSLAFHITHAAQGVVLIADVRHATATNYKAKVELMQARLGYLLAWAELERTVGRPDTGIGDAVKSQLGKTMTLLDRRTARVMPSRLAETLRHVDENTAREWQRLQLLAARVLLEAFTEHYRLTPGL